MQQEAKKKNNKLIWLIVGLAALLVVVGVVLAIFLMPGNQAPAETGPVGGRADLYWNADRATYVDMETGMSNREPGEDGLYHVRFAYNGELVEYTIADKRLINAIDTMDIVGLVKDESGNVIDAVDPTTIATEVARNAYVQRMNPNGFTVNSSIAMNGMETMIQFCDLTQVYDVTENAEIPGQIGEAELMDETIIYSNDKGEITHIFLVKRQPKADVYWRIDPKNVDSNGNTKREPDENGIYHIMFAKDGEQVELKCKDKLIVNEIDSLSTRMSDIALQVDEEGFITGTVDTAIALRGKLMGAGYHITGINGNEVAATYMFAGGEAGKSFNITLNENTKIYNVCMSGVAEYIGAPDQLQLEDRVIVYTDLDGNPVLIFIMMRKYNADIVYNINRQYNSTTKETKREPNASGYYEFLVAINGEQRTIRTKDKALASKLDSFSNKIAGVMLDGDIITGVCQDMYVAGHYKYTTSSTRIIQGQTGVILSFVTAGQGLDTVANLVLAPNAGIYDISGRPGTKIGEPTTVKEGDLVRLLADYQNNITHVFVVSSYSGNPVYYNLARQLDSKTNETKRVPDEQGYYVFDMATGGKQVTVKTKSKEIATFIDQQSPYTVSLDVSNGIIRGAYPAPSAYEYGYAVCNWGYFERYNGKKSMNALNSGGNNSTRYKLSENVKVYNCSQAYENFRGEPATLREGDRISAIAVGDTQEIVEIFINTRQIESEMYYHANRQYNSETKETKREPVNGYYVFDLVVNGTIKQFKTKSKELASKVDSQAQAFGMRVNGNIIEAVFPASCVKGVGKTVANKYDVVSTSGGILKLESLCPTNTSLGNKTEAPLASNCQIYNVSTYAKQVGEKSSLKVGDRVICYANMDGEVQWVYILYKNTHEKGAYSYCEHCDQEVYWHPYERKAYDVPTHVYVPNDRVWSSASIGDSKVPFEERAELILDLNGKTMELRNRLSVVYGTLSIVDTVGGGKIVGDMDNTGAQALVCSGGGVINLYSGTVTRNPESKDLKNGGGCIKVGGNSVFNMYGGTVVGGIADVGGNIFSSSGTVNIYGGKVTGGKAPLGANIIIGGKATFNMTGGVVDGDVLINGNTAKVNIGGTAVINKGEQGGLILPGGMKLPLKDVTSKTKVYVDAAGIFTEKVSNPEKYKANFISTDKEMPVTALDGALGIGKAIKCAHCDGKTVLFGKFSPSACAGETHLIVLEDVTLTEQIKIAYDAKVVIDLNGHTITMKDPTTIKDAPAAATGRFAQVVGTLSIQDSKGNGKIVSQQKGVAAGGVIRVLSDEEKEIYGVFNLYSGELTLAKGAYAIGSGGVVAVRPYAYFNMYGGKISNGRVCDNPNDDYANMGGNVNISGKGNFTMSGGEIVGGAGAETNTEALQGGNVLIGSGAKFTMTGGTISGGVAEQGGNVFASADINMTGGTIKDGVAKFVVNTNKDGKKYVSYGMGGNIFINRNSTSVIGGTVSGGSAPTGGNIYLNDKNVVVTVDKKGVVENGVAVEPFEGSTTHAGGNIYMAAADNEDDKTYAMTVTIKGTVTGGTAFNSGNIHALKDTLIAIDGGVVSKGTATGYTGGNISSQGVIEMTNGAVVTEGNATVDAPSYGRGGNIFVNAGKLIMSKDSKISNGAGITGGNIYIDKANSELKVEASQIIGGVAKQQGGNIFANNGATVTIDGTVSGGIANVGGNIYMSKTNVNVTVEKNGIIENGTAIAVEEGSTSHNGGNIVMYADDDGNPKTYAMTLTIKGTVTGGTAFNSGNIDALADTKIVIDGGVVSKGTAVGYTGGNISTKGILLMVNGAVVTEGNASNTAASSYGRGGNIFVNGGQLLMAADSVVSYGNGNIGGNIYVDKANAILDIEPGASVIGGTAVTNANSVFVNKPKSDGEFNILEISGSVIAGALAEGTEPTGGDVIVNGANTLVTVSGTPVINKLSLAAGNLINVGTLDEGTSIGISAGGVFTGALESEDLADEYATNGYFVAVDEGMNIVAEGNTIACKSDSIIKKYCEHCQAEVDFTAFKGFAESGSNIFTNDAHIIFTDVLTLDKQFQVGVADNSETADIDESVRDLDVVIDLNGKTVDVLATGSHSTGRLALAYGNLFIQDSSEEKTGKVIGTCESNGGVIMTSGAAEFGANGGNVTLYSGELAYSGNGASKGGIVSVSRGEFIINGGKINGAEASIDGNGGAIFLSRSKFTMNNGEIIGGSAAMGGSIYAEAKSTIMLNGGTISGGTAEQGGNIYLTHGEGRIDVKCDALIGGTAAEGGNIYINNGRVVVTGAKVTGGDIYLDNANANSSLVFSGAAQATVKLENGKKMQIASAGLADGAEIAVNANGIFAELADEQTAIDYLANGYIVSADSRTITRDGNKLSFEAVSENLRFCQHCQQNVEFVPFEAFGSNSSDLLTSKHIIFTEACTQVDKQFYIGGLNDKIRTVDLVLDLNGLTVTAPNNGGHSTGRIAVVYGSLYIQDSSAEKTGKIIGNSTANGGVILAAGDSARAQAFIKGESTEGFLGGNVVIYSGELTYAGAGAPKGGVVDISYAILDIQGGKINGGISNTVGGNINMTWAKLVMENCEMTGGTATTNGGNICAAASLVNISNSTIGGGTATGMGDNIYVRHNNSIVTITGDVFDNGTATGKRDLQINDAASVTLAGDIKANVVLNTGAKFVLGALNNAEIFVTADDGVITAASTDASTYLDYVKAADAENKAITVDGEGQMVLGNK